MTKTQKKIWIFISLIVCIGVIAVYFAFHQSLIPKELYAPSLPGSDSIRVMAYNVENLFDLQDNGMEYPLFKKENPSWNYDMYQIKLNNIAQVICAFKPDICILCEIENIHVLKDLQKTCKEKGLTLQYVCCGEQMFNSPTTQAVLSRFPIIDHQDILVPHSSIKRSILEATIMIDSLKFTLFSVHFPSKHHKESLRIAFASALMRRLQELSSQTEYCIAGDFNSNYNEAETFFTEGLDDQNGVTGINHILKTVQSKPKQFLTFVDKIDLITHPDSLFHFNPWLEIPQNKRMSYVYQGMKNTLDNMLFPVTLFNSTGLSYIDSSFGTFTWNDRLLMNEKPFAWQVRSSRNKELYHSGVGYSDHLPITALITKKPYRFIKPLAQDTIIQSVDSSLIPSKTQGTISFETGFEGFVAHSKHITIIRDTPGYEGKWCLQVSGLPKNNRVACRIRFPLNPTTPKTPHDSVRLSYYIKGTGFLVSSLRLGTGTWSYFNGLPFTKRAGKPRYLEFSSTQWQNITHALPRESGDTNSFIEFNIRCGKNNTVQIWIDKFVFSP